MKLEMLNRAATAAVLVALAITLGVWLTRKPLTAAPAPNAAPTAVPVPENTPPAKPSVPLRPVAFSEPTLAPLPLGSAAPAASPRTVTTEVEISYEIAPLPTTSVVADTPTPTPPVAKPTETPAVRQQVCQPADCQQNYRRGLFRRR